jgi:hypothetical protein
MDIRDLAERPSVDEIVPVVRWSEITRFEALRKRQLVILTRTHLMAAQVASDFPLDDALYGDGVREFLKANRSRMFAPLDLPLGLLGRLKITQTTITDGFRRERKALKFEALRSDQPGWHSFKLPLFDCLYLLAALEDLLGDTLEVDETVYQTIAARDARAQAAAEALSAENRAKAGTVAKPSPVAGLILMGMGFVLLLGWPLLGLLENWLALLLAIFVGVPIGAGLLGTGRRMRLPDYETALSRDPRAPVLYLRSFGSEDVAIPVRPPGLGGELVRRLWDRAWFFSLPGMAVVWLLRLFYTMCGLAGDRLEEQIARVVRKTGPLIAIGKPGEAIATGGAIRAYLSDENWQDFILARIGESRCVLLQIEPTAGTWWEFRQCIARIPRERLVLMLTARFGSLQRYDEIRLLAWRAMGLALPRNPGEAAFLFFDRDGTPHRAPIVWHPYLLGWLMPSHINMTKTMSPIMRHIDGL